MRLRQGYPLTFSQMGGEGRRRQLAAIVAWVLAGARSQPVALAIEDLHWADPTCNLQIKEGAG